MSDEIEYVGVFFGIGQDGPVRIMSLPSPLEAASKRLKDAVAKEPAVRLAMLVPWDAEWTDMENAIELVYGPAHGGLTIRRTQ